MIDTIYGDVKNNSVKNQYEIMIGKVFKILHLKEEECSTIDKYIGSLSRKFIGASKLYFENENISIVHILNGLNFENHDELRSDVFEMIRIIELIKKRCDE